MPFRDRPRDLTVRCILSTARKFFIEIKGSEGRGVGGGDQISCDVLSTPQDNWRRRTEEERGGHVDDRDGTVETGGHLNCILPVGAAATCFTLRPAATAHLDTRKKI